MAEGPAVADFVGAAVGLSSRSGVRVAVGSGFGAVAVAVGGDVTVLVALGSAVDVAVGATDAVAVGGASVGVEEGMGVLVDVAGTGVAVEVAVAGGTVAVGVAVAVAGRTVEVGDGSMRGVFVATKASVGVSDGAGTEVEVADGVTATVVATGNVVDVALWVPVVAVTVTDVRAVGDGEAVAVTGGAGVGGTDVGVRGTNGAGWVGGAVSSEVGSGSKAEALVGTDVGTAVAVGSGRSMTRTVGDGDGSIVGTAATSPTSVGSDGADVGSSVSISAGG